MLEKRCKTRIDGVGPRIKLGLLYKYSINSCLYLMASATIWSHNSQLIITNIIVDDQFFGHFSKQIHVLSLPPSLYLYQKKTLIHSTFLMLTTLTLPSHRKTTDSA